MGYSRLQLKHLQHGILNLLANHATDPKGKIGPPTAGAIWAAYWPAKHFENLDIWGWSLNQPFHQITTVFCEWMDPNHLIWMMLP